MSVSELPPAFGCSRRVDSFADTLDFCGGEHRASGISDGFILAIAP